MIKRALLRLVLPLVCAWARRQESIILREGAALTASQAAAARRIGVVHPERVRLQFVEEMPLPLVPFLRRVGESTGLIPTGTLGMTLRYGIFIRSDCGSDRRLLVHELAHTAQYERLGGFEAFLKQYLQECLTPPGYPFGPLEQEATRIEQEIAK